MFEQARGANLRAIVDELHSQGVTSVRAIAAELNARGILTPRGDSWHPMSTARLLARLANYPALLRVLGRTSLTPI
jgi:hypothetical protein